jgi:hypothetical protein
VVDDDDALMTVGQFEICEFIGDMFTGAAVSTDALVKTAQARGARPAVLDVLRHLDHSQYRQFADFVHDLAHLPRDVDPWGDR